MVHYCKKTRFDQLGACLAYNLLQNNLVVFRRVSECSAREMTQINEARRIKHKLLIS